MKLTRKTFLCTDMQLKMIQEIMKKAGLKTETAVFDMALNTQYEKSFKYGADPLNNPQDNDSPDTIKSKAERKALAKKAGEDASLQAKFAPKIDMCVNLLGGEVIENENGHKFCKYTTYSLNGDYEQKMPIMAVDPVIAKTSLFTPTQEVIFSERKDVAKKFKKLSYYEQIK